MVVVIFMLEYSRPGGIMDVFLPSIAGSPSQGGICCTDCQRPFLLDTHHILNLLTWILLLAYG